MLDLLTEILKGIISIIMYFWWLFALIFAFFAWQNRRKAKFVENAEFVTIEIKIPKTNDKNPTSAEMMFATLHGILKPKSEHVKNGTIQEHISFEMVANETSIRFFVWCPRHLKDFVEGQIYAQYPSAEINEVEDYSKQLNLELEGGTYHAAGAEITLTKKDYLPIKTFNNFTVDPLAGITGVLSKLDQPGENIWIQILARPVQDEWKQRGLNWVAKKKGQSSTLDIEHLGRDLVLGFFKILAEFVKIIVSGPADGDGANNKKSLSAEEEGMISAVEQKAEKLAYSVKIRILYSADKNEKTNERLHAIFGAFKQFNTTNLNGFKGKHLKATPEFIRDYQNRLFLPDGFYLNIEELASIYHLPHTSVETPNISWTTSKTGEPPTNLPTLKNTPEEDLTIFAKTNFRGVSEEFGIKRDDRRRHMYIIGKSGMGKTKLQESLVNRDIRMGEGIAVMDPHGDFIMDVLSKIPEERLNDVIIFDPADTEFPIAFNPMEVTDPNLKNQIASGVVNTFKKIFGTSWGPRLEYILNYTVLALLDSPNTTLLGIVNMLTDKNFRKDIISNIQDPVVKKFWTTEFASYNEKFATEAIAPILNKVGQFVANSLIRNVIGQPKSSFNIREIMDHKKILLINLSTGRVGETNASLLGSLMITAIQLAAMSRADMPEEDRADFYLYVDEFQNFATESFKNILSEARKYHLNLTVAHQYIAQMEDTGVRDAIFGNVGTMITFRVGAEDANVLAKEFNPPFDVSDLINLERQNIYIKMTIDGKSEGAFSAKTLTVNNERTEFTQTIINHSRKLYTKPRAGVEELIVNWQGAAAIPDNPDLVRQLEREKEKAAASTTRTGDTENTFEAPIVKSLRGNKKFKNDQKSEIAAAIKSGTAHLAEGEDSEQNNNPTPKPETDSKMSEAGVLDELEQTADYIVRHEKGDNKFVFLPENKPQNIIPDPKGRQKGHDYVKNGKTIYRVKIDMYEPKDTEKIFKKDHGPDIWVGTQDELLDQMDAITAGGGGTKFIGIEDNTKDKSVLANKIKDREAEKKQTGTIADRISKETLSEILKGAVTPSTGNKGESAKEIINNKKEEDKKISQPKGESGTKNENLEFKTDNSILAKDETPVSPSSRKEKIITPENFKKVKEIHPHEIVTIASGNEPADISEGEEIKFK